MKGKERKSSIPTSNTFQANSVVESNVHFLYYYGLGKEGGSFDDKL